MRQHTEGMNWKYYNMDFARNLLLFQAVTEF